MCFNYLNFLSLRCNYFVILFSCMLSKVDYNQESCVISDLDVLIKFFN